MVPSSQLKVVVVDFPAMVWDNPQTREFFAKLSALKSDSYHADFEGPVLPVDTMDFLGTHIAICSEDGQGNLEPLLTFRSITLERCEEFRLTFPAVTLARTSKATEHEASLQALLERAKKSHQQIRFCSPVALSPAVRGDQILVQRLKQIHAALQLHFLRDSGTHISLLTGMIKSKGDQMFESWGYRPLAGEDGKPLPNIFQWSLYGAEVSLMQLEQFSSKVRTWAAEYVGLWQNRLTFAPTAEEIAKRKAA